MTVLYMGALLPIAEEIPSIAAILCVIGAVLLVGEIFTPGFGLCGGLGFACLFFAILFAAESVLQALVLTLILLAVAALFFGILIRSASRGILSKTLVLRYQTDAAQGFSATPDYEKLIGRIGITETVLRPSGIAEIDGKRVDVIAQGEMIPAGTEVEVVEAAGNRVVVRRKM